MSERLPLTLGRYSLLERLGRGGMGHVYLARVDGSHGIQKLCVVKTLRPDLAAEREYVTRFLDEARLVMQLSHRNICSVFDAGEVDGQYFLAMDLVAGTDLRTLWDAANDAGRPIDPSLALYVVIEMLEGLDYAHRAVDMKGRPLHVVHRDVSPHNVMVSAEGGVQLIDFGLAFSLHKVERTKTDVVHGKVSYMPPEQIRGKDVDKRADVFAAAVVLYELLAHARYYEGVAKHDLLSIAAAGTHEPPAWRLLDGGLRSILGAALAPDPADRTPSAGRFAQALRAHAIAHGLRSDATEMRACMLELFGDEGSHEDRSERTVMIHQRDAAVALSPRRAGTRVTDRGHGRGRGDAAPAAVGSRPLLSLASGPASAPTDARIDVAVLAQDAARFAGPARRTEERTPTFGRPAQERMSSDRRAEPTLTLQPMGLGGERSVPTVKRLPDVVETDRSGTSQPRVSVVAPPIVPSSSSVPATQAAPAPPARPARPAHSPESTKDIARRAALAGGALLVLLVALVAVAPWQSSAPRPTKLPLPPRASVGEKVEFLRRWCPELTCAAPLLDATTEAGSSSAAADACYRQCLGR